MLRDKLDTYPVLEAFRSGEECPFCFAARELERRGIEFTVGPSSSYMQKNIRCLTDEAGFCRRHLKAMYDYGNFLGDALIVQTWENVFWSRWKKKADAYKPFRRNLLGLQKKGEKQPEGPSELVTFLREREKSCFLCARVRESYERLLETFFAMLREEDFRRTVETSRGFCMKHLADVMEYAERKLPDKLTDWFYPTIFRLTEENMSRVREDLNWFIHKHDYRNQDADWKNSRDAVPRMMERLVGGDPRDVPVKSK